MDAEFDMEREVMDSEMKASDATETLDSICKRIKKLDDFMVMVNYNLQNLLKIIAYIHKHGNSDVNTKSIAYLETWMKETKAAVLNGNTVDDEKNHDQPETENEIIARNFNTGNFQPIPIISISDYIAKCVGPVDLDNLKLLMEGEQNNTAGVDANADADADADSDAIESKI